MKKPFYGVRFRFEGYPARLLVKCFSLSDAYRAKDDFKRESWLKGADIYVTGLKPDEVIYSR